jgi:hypothetical protein
MTSPKEPSMPITAAQLFYANVPAERSPHRRGGFQTLGHSAALAEADVDAIEPRLLYRPGADAVPKGVFFPLDAERLAVARIVAVVGTDAFGRGGRYLAHALVIDRADWVAAGLDPCTLLAAAPFVTDLEQALAAVAEPPLPALALEPAAPTAGKVAAGAWPTAALGRLMLWALRAPERAAAREVLALIGPADVVEAVLAALFTALPMALRPACSFDSNFDGGNLVATPWWAVGLPQAPPSGRYQCIDAATLEPLDDLSPPTPRSPYEHWLLARVRGLGSAADRATLEGELASAREPAWAVSRWLEADLPAAALPAPAAMPAEVFAGVCATDPVLTTRRVQVRLADALPPPLVALVLPMLAPRRTDLERYAELRAGFAPATLADWLWTVLTGAGPTAVSPAGLRGLGQRLPPALRPPPLTAAERAALGTWLDAHPDERLRALSSCWEQDWDALSATLAGLDLAAYARLLPTLLTTGAAPPLRLLLPGRGEALVTAWMALRRQAPLSVTKLAAALLAQEPAALDALVPLVPRLGRGACKALDALLKDAPQAAPAAFAAALAAALAQPRRRLIALGKGRRR